MAYFDCTIGSAGEFSIPLVVTCTANFAGKTITCSDGTTTLTGTCPSASPYEVTFELPNTGTWTVSGTISGHTFSDSVLVNEFDAELTDEIDITVDVYSAANDTVSYVGVDGQTHTISTDSSGHASSTITIRANGSTLTFTSSIAKGPDNLLNSYSKSISLTSATSAIYVMPNKDVLYWWGYIGNNCEILSTTNGWTAKKTSSGQVYTFVSPTYNTNNIYLPKRSAGTGTQCSGVGNKTALSLNNTTVKMVAKSVNMSSTNGVSLDSLSAKNFATSVVDNVAQNVLNTIETKSLTSVSSPYIAVERINDNGGYLYALWYEE